VHVTVLGAGSWGTTVASLTVASHPTTLWARDPVVASEVRLSQTNSTYLPGISLPRGITATSHLEKAVSSADVLILPEAFVRFSALRWSGYVPGSPWSVSQKV